MQFLSTSMKKKFGTIIILQVLMATILFAGINMGCKSTNRINKTTGISTQIIEPNYLLEWNVTYGTTGYDYGEGVTVDSNGYIYLVGYFYNATQINNDAFIMKYNWTGEELLEITYDFAGEDDRGYGVAVDNLGAIYLTGSTSDGSFSGSSQDGLLIKYNSLGVKQPSYHIGSIYDDAGYDIKAAGDYVYVTGERGTASGTTNLFLYKYDLSLSNEWGVTLGGSQDEEGHALTIDSDGDVYVTGISNSWDLGGGDTLVAKYNDLGTKQWNITWGSSSYEIGRAIAIDDTYCYVVGSTNAYYGVEYSTTYMTRLSKATGAVSVTAYWGGDGEDFGYGLARDSSGNFLIAGSTSSYGEGIYDAFIAKYDSPYSSQWNVTWGGIASDLCRDIALDARDNAYIVGSTYNYGSGNTDAFLAKYGIDSDGDGYTIDQELVAGTDPDDPTDYPGAPIPGFQYSYILLAIIMLLGVLFYLNKSNSLSLKKI